MSCRTDTGYLELMKMNICLYGSGSREIDEIYTDNAYELGCEIAKHGHTLVFGGGDTGMMGACARGVHDNNGKSLGIAPPWIGDFEPLCEDCSEFIYVNSMDERKNKFDHAVRLLPAHHGQRLFPDRSGGQCLLF